MFCCTGASERFSPERPPSLSMKPYFQKLICDTETPVSLYKKLAQGHTYAFLLESAESHERFGRYSFIGFDPLHIFIFPAGGHKNPLSILQKAYEEIVYTPDPNLPNLQAGFVGYFSYETVRHFEKLKLPTDTSDIPEGIFFLPRYLLIFDHFEHTLTLVAYSKEDLERLHKDVLRVIPDETPSSFMSSSAPPRLAGGLAMAGKAEDLLDSPVRPENDKSHFQSIVLTAQERICAGETFQIVLSQLFQQKTEIPPFDLYRRLRVLSPSPYMYYLQYQNFSVIGSSPETLVRTEGDEIILRPIAGTRRRGRTEEEDSFFEDEMKNDIKEQAEHMMLVDLGRNDIGRIAKQGSVRVTRLMEIEKYSHVMHLVSEVRGKRAADRSLFDIFKASFPAGTLTGAPKIRAISIIAELEKQPRGIYGGAVGYFDLSGNMDFAIAIRTMVYKNKTVSLRAGAGIVYDSKPELEHKECCNKAKGPLSAVL